MLIDWGKGSAGNLGRIEGTDYRCERYWVKRGSGKEFWYLLSDNQVTYLSSDGPFKSPQERDQAILTEVDKRHEYKKGDK